MRAIQIAFILLFSLPVLAQEAPQVSYRFEQDTVWVTGTQTIMNRLVVVNKTADTIVLDKADASNIGGIIELPSEVVALPGESSYYPIKFLATPAAVRSIGRIYEISYKPRVPKKFTTNSYAQFVLSYDMSRTRLSISVVEPYIYVNNRNQIGTIWIKCMNDGFEDADIEVRATSYPEGLEFDERVRKIRVPAGQSVTLPFHPTNVSRKKYAPDYTINITALDEAYNVIGTGIAKLISLSDHKRFDVSDDPYFDRMRNYAELTGIYNNNNNFYYQFHLQGAKALNEDATLKYNLNGNFYTGNATHTTDIFDTWLEYQSEKIGVKAGNIYENLDYVLFGKGVKVSLAPEKMHHFEAYYVNNSPNLYSNSPYTPQSANVYAAGYTYNDSGRIVNRITNVFANDPYLQTKTDVLTNQFQFLVDKNTRIEATAGYSTESSNTQQQHGAALMVNFTKRKNKFDFFSGNYWSSPAYAGLRRGTLQLEEKLTYQVNPGFHVYGRYNKMAYDPNFLTSDALMRRQYNNAAIYEAGAYKSWKQVQVMLKGYVFNQKFLEFSNQTAKEQLAKSNSLRAAADVHFSHERHSLSLTADVGSNSVDREAMEAQNIFSTRVVANYSYKFFGFNAMLQKGPYYITDIVNSNSSDFEQYSAGPSFTFSEPEEGLQATLGGYVTYSSYAQGWTYMATGSIKYEFLKSWSFLGNVMYSRFFNMNVYTLRFGVRKDFFSRRLNGREMKLRVFGDANNNGLKDDGERYIKGVVLDVSGTVAATNEKGTITLANVPDKKHMVRLIEGKGWYMPDSPNIEGRQKKHHPVLLPLIKSGYLRGAVKVVQKKYDIALSDKEGIKVIMTDSLGREFRTFTDAAGNFSTSLPEGKYKVEVVPILDRFKPVDAIKDVEVTESKTTEVELELLDVKREVDVKRF